MKLAFDRADNDNVTMAERVEAYILQSSSLYFD